MNEELNEKIENWIAMEELPVRNNLKVIKGFDPYEGMDEDEFYQSLYSVARIADEYDDKIISSHGGKSAMDVLIEDLFKK